MKIPKWQGNARAAHHHRAWKRVCITNVYFFYVFFGFRSCFSCTNSPETLFLSETLHISRPKTKETACNRKNGTSPIHTTIAKKSTKFDGNKNTKEII
jgi:hypothetical protein